MCGRVLNVLQSGFGLCNKQYCSVLVCVKDIVKGGIYVKVQYIFTIYKNDIKVQNLYDSFTVIFKLF